MPKNVFFGLFFKILPAAQKHLPQQGLWVFLVLCESSENQFGRPKKKGRQNFQKIFENPPPASRKSRSAPGGNNQFLSVLGFILIKKYSIFLDLIHRVKNQLNVNLFRLVCLGKYSWVFPLLAIAIEIFLLSGAILLHEYRQNQRAEQRHLLPTTTSTNTNAAAISSASKRNQPQSLYAQPTPQVHLIICNNNL